MSEDSRFFYIVRPLGSQWQITFGDQDARFLYASEEEALQIARGAAKAHWDTRQQLSGVHLMRADDTLVVIAIFGPAE